jgi:hypothetical protein
MPYINNKILQNPIKQEVIELEVIKSVSSSQTQCSPTSPGSTHHMVNESTDSDNHLTGFISINGTEFATTNEVNFQKKTAIATFQYASPDQLFQGSVNAKVENLNINDSEIVIIYENYTFKQCEIYRMCFVITIMVVALVSGLVLLSCIEHLEKLSFIYSGHHFTVS